MVVSSGDFLLTAKVSWKPLRSLLLVTWTLVSASVTGLGAGMGTTGPIISVRWIPLSIQWHSRYAFGQRDAEHTADCGGEIVGAHRAIGVAYAPELQRIVHVCRSYVVEAIALRDGMHLQQREALRLWYKAAIQVDDGLA